MIDRVERLTPRQTLLVVALITVAGVALRLIHWGFPLYGDELSTLWIVRDRSLGEVLDLVRSDAEITPPLYFGAAWLATRFGEAPELVRLPALLAGIAAIPMTWLLGKRTLGNAAGLIAAAIFALSPFMTYFSADGRAYTFMVFFLIASALAMLAATRTGKAVWWVAFGASALLAMLSHYTAAFVLIAQFAWLFWAHPGSRRPAGITLVVSAVAYLPWLSSFRADMDSPTTDILETIQGSGFTAKRVAVEQVLAGHPLTEIQAVPGRAGLVLICLGLLLALVAATARYLGERDGGAPSKEMVLVIAMTLATPVLALVLMAFGTDIFGARNLTSLWAGLPVLIGGLLVASRGVAALVATLLVLGGFGIAAVRSTQGDRVATGYEQAAAFIDETAEPGDVIVDTSHKGYTPVPITPLDIQLESELPEYRPGMPLGDPPFLPFVSKVPDTRTLLREAAADAGSARVFVVTADPPVADPTVVDEVVLPGRWEEVESRTWPGRNPVTVTVLESE